MSEKVVKPYHEEGSKKNQVGQMFNNIAGSYDLLNRTLSLGIDQRWRKKAIAELSGLHPEKVLDVATGTADVALALSNQPGVREVVGVDIAVKMLEIGREKVARRSKTEQITLLEGDSENLPFEDAQFDAATVAFGVRNFENLEKGIGEIGRVLKPGGRLVVLEFSKPRVFPFKQLYQFYFKNILPRLGKRMSKDPKAYQYLYESVQVFPEGEAFLEKMRKQGFGNVKAKSLTLGVCTIYVGDKN